LAARPQQLSGLCCSLSCRLVLCHQPLCKYANPMPWSVTTHTTSSAPSHPSVKRKLGSPPQPMLTRVKARVYECWRSCATACGGCGVDARLCSCIGVASDQETVPIIRASSVSGGAAGVFFHFFLIPKVAGFNVRNTEFSKGSRPAATCGKRIIRMGALVCSTAANWHGLGTFSPHPPA
jgi:hypothetical protein